MKNNNSFECSAVINGFEIEFTNYCGLDCLGCIRKKDKDFGFINLETLKKILHLVSNNNYKELVISGLGDVFLHPKLYIYIDYIFKEYPDLSIYIMSKGQSISYNDIIRLYNYKRKGKNIGLTYSIFTLNKEKYKFLTGGGNLYDLLKVIKLSNDIKINFNFEFLISLYSLNEINSFKNFSKFFNKSFFFSIPHNWGGHLDNKTYLKLFSKDKLEKFYHTRSDSDICEAFSSNYLFFDYKGNIYKCGLSRLSNKLFIGNVFDFNDNINYKLNINHYLDYCKDCSYFKYKTNIKG